MRFIAGGVDTTIVVDFDLARAVSGTAEAADSDGQVVALAILLGIDADSA